MDTLVIVAVLGLGGLFTAAIVAALRHEGKTAEARKQALEDAGYRPVATLDDGRLGTATMLAGVHNGTAREVFERELGSARFTLLSLVDTGSDSAKSVRSVLIQSPKLELPRLSLFPRGGFGTLLGKLMDFAMKTYAERHGLKQLECTAAPALAEQFFVVGQSESDVAAAFDDRVVAALKTLEAAVTIDCNGSAILLRAILTNAPAGETPQLIAASNLVYAAFSDVRPRATVGG